MHQDDIACGRSILPHLQRNAVALLDAFVEPLDARSRVAPSAFASCGTKRRFGLQVLR
jgi:hypothetical protein